MPLEPMVPVNDGGTFTEDLIEQESQVAPAGLFINFVSLFDIGVGTVSPVKLIEQVSA